MQRKTVYAIDWYTTRFQGWACTTPQLKLIIYYPSNERAPLMLPFARNEEGSKTKRRRPQLHRKTPTSRRQRGIVYYAEPFWQTPLTDMTEPTVACGLLAPLSGKPLHRIKQLSIALVCHIHDSWGLHKFGWGCS